MGECELGREALAGCCEFLREIEPAGVLVFLCCFFIVKVCMSFTRVVAKYLQ